MGTKGLGDRGEELAVRHLRRLGYRIVERNYRCRLGEIDCVAIQGGTLVFCEVKTRRSDVYGGPLEAVDGRKRRKMTRLAQHYVAAKGLDGVAQRFDVVAVWVGSGGARVEVYPDAFEAEE
ncbi:MAG: YraN family protein [Deferrisomatales bacterium]